MSALLTRTTRIARPSSEVAAYLARPGVIARLAPPWTTGSASANGFIAATHIKSDSHDICTLTEELRAPESLEIAPAILERALAHRHATIRDDVEHAAAYGCVRRLCVAVPGASGLIGRALVPFLQAQGHKVVTLARNPATDAYDPAQLVQSLHGVDAVINLAGASIAAQPWTQPRRDLIWESRAAATRALVAALAKLKHRPYAFLGASAAGYYGTRGDDILDETAPPPPVGAGFLSDVCAGWEHEAAAADKLGIRVTTLRLGTVLTPAGGALATMLPYFHKKLGGKLGHGRQWASWISIDDCVAAIYHILLTRACAGPVNITAPNPVTNAGFAEILNGALGKTHTRSIPHWLLRLRHGIDFANETLLASQRMEPAKLRATGYHFRHPALENALARLLP